MNPQAGMQVGDDGQTETHVFTVRSLSRLNVKRRPRIERWMVHPVSAGSG